MNIYYDFDLNLGEIPALSSKILFGFKEIEKDFDEKELKEFKRSIGKYVYEILEFRTKLYEKYPNLTQDYIKEEKQNHTRMEKLRKIQGEAIMAFREKKYEIAKEKFAELLQKAEFGYYKLEAEVRLYECEHRLKGNLDEIQMKAYQTFEKLDEIYQKGLKFENKKEFEKAIEIYENLLKISKFSEFENKAMAGLYRCEKALNLY